MKSSKALLRLEGYSLILVLTLSSLIHYSVGLYEDQIGKFDWRHKYVGEVLEAKLDPSSNDRIIVTSKENVVAAISARTGDILWRSILEADSRGEIKLLHVPLESSQNLATSSSRLTGNEIITVNGVNTTLVRGWDPSTGNLAWEWSLTPVSVNEAQDGLWFHHDHYLYHVIPVWNSHLEVTAYLSLTGQQLKPTTTKLQTSWIKKEKCLLAEPYFICSDSDRQDLILINLVSHRNEITRKELPSAVNKGTIVLSKAKGINDCILVNNVLVSLTKETIPNGVIVNGPVFVGNQISEEYLFEAQLEANNIINIIAKKLPNLSIIQNLQFTTNYPKHLGKPVIHDLKCRSKNDDQVAACRYLVSGEDGSIMLLQQNKIRWIREESLSNIIALEMIELPLSDAEGVLESELNNKDGNVLGSLYRRIHSQITHIRNVFLTVIGLGASPSDSEKAGLVRDSFGLHKMIVTITKSGKLFGLDNLSGKIMWSTYLPNHIKNFKILKLVVQRTSKHFPHFAQCAIIGKSQIDEGKFSNVIYEFNAITGEKVGQKSDSLPSVIEQVAVIPETGSSHLRNIMMLSDKGAVSVHGKSTNGNDNYRDMYMFTANTKTSQLSGYFIGSGANQAVLNWKIDLSGTGKNKIIAVASKNSNEHVHSQGRVLNDRSVLYKYINPNLVAVATLGPDSIHKTILNVHLIDVVSGSIVHTSTHRRVREPVSIVHTENLLAYSYYNEKLRRTELTTVELYEGKSQANSSAFSSLDAPLMPIIERQSYIIAGYITTMKETITEKGITNKDILIGFSSGAILQMPWMLLDPRRPMVGPNTPREEGVIPYIPELPIASENIINYNLTVANIKSIYTAPSGLESTCLVVACGLDIFVTRVAPSKTFDLLKDDFDYFLITVVLVGLTTASGIVKHLASRKALKQAWK